MQAKENIIVGDIHACKDEFNQLLDKLKYDPKKHRIILVGDIIDRGNDPVGLVKQIRKMGIESVKGNHEEKCLRWRKHETLKKLTGKENPMKEISKERKTEWESFSDNDIKWMSNLPLQIHIKDNWYVVHAGLEPAVSFDKQDIEKIIRIRYVDKNGNLVRPKTKDKPEGTYFWAEKWNQPFNIIFGHQRHSEPTLYNNSNNVCIAIDCGCVFGGSLVAYNIEQNTFTSVKAKKIYYKK